MCGREIRKLQVHYSNSLQAAVEVISDIIGKFRHDYLGTEQHEEEYERWALRNSQD